MVIWRRGSEVIAMGKNLMGKDPRYKLEDHGKRGNTLVISLAESGDAGQYICQMSSPDRPTELKHVARIRGEKKY